jgi:hypothetical protein
MGAATKKCEKGKDPKTCSLEQIRKCHGKDAGHPCGTGASPRKRK